MNIRRLTHSDAADYRGLMLNAYGQEPKAFTATVAERESLPLEWWENRVSDEENAPELVLGAFVEHQLIGVAGLRFEQRPRTKHKATLFGMMVVPMHRRVGIGRALVEATIAQAAARVGTTVIQLTLSESNAAATRLYESCGFEAFGVEPMALTYEDGYLGKIHMWKALKPTERH